MITDSASSLRILAVGTALLLVTSVATADKQQLAPSIQALRYNAILPEPLQSATNNPDSAEAEALLQALWQHDQRPTHDDFSVLEEYLKENPGSPWEASVQMNLGLLYYKTGYFTRSIGAYQQAWTSAKMSKTPAGSKVAERAVAELALMYARLGRMAELDALLLEVRELPFSGPSRVSIDRAAEGLGKMKHKPGVSFRCGPYALQNVAHALGKEVPEAFLRENPSTKEGFSMAALSKISPAIGLQTRVVRRVKGQPVPVPSVMHLRSGHYAAVLAKSEGGYSIVDPTFGNNTRMSERAVDDECSGLFLVVQDTTQAMLVDGSQLTAVSEAEAASTFGKGHSGNGDPGTTKKICPCEGMATYSFHKMATSLSVQDAPLSIVSPLGPPLALEIAYHQRENGRASSPSYTHFGEQWVSDWMSWIDEVEAIAGDVMVYLPGGGHEEHEINAQTSTTKLYTRQPDSGSQLYRVASGSYEMRFKDGSKHIYQRAVGSSPPRKVFLSSIRDPQGNVLTINYDTNPSYPARILSVTNASGRNLHLFYDDSSDPFLVTKAADNGTFASAVKKTTLTYVNDGSVSRLESITDPVGISSEFSYDEAGFMTSMTTPYGTSTFENIVFDPMEWPARRALHMTDPMGLSERLEYRVDVMLAAPASVPSGVNVEAVHDWDDRIAFYWSKKAWRMAPGDPAAAHAYKWLQKGGIDFSVNVLEWEKPANEDIIWYNYPGQTSGPSSRGTAPTPSAVAKVGEDENGNPQTRLTSSTYHATSGNPLTQTNPEGVQTRYNYDTAGMNVTSAQVLEGATWRTLQSATYTNATYAAMYRPTTTTDAQGITTTYTYNAKGQPVTASSSSIVSTTQTVVVRWTYDATGTSSTIPAHVAAASSVPGFLRRVEVTNPLSPSTYVTIATYTYDAQGRLSSTADAAGRIHTYQYDALDRSTLVTYPDSTTVTTSYLQDEVMILHPTEQVDREGKRTRTRYNKNGQIIMTIDAKQQASFYEWCRCGGLQKFTNPSGGVVSWKYDAQGRMYEKVGSGGDVTSYTFYPRSGNLKTVTYPNDQDSGHPTYTLSYNAKGQLIGRNYHDSATADITYTYDWLGRMATMVAGTDTTTLTYATLNQTAAAGQVSYIDGPWDDDAMRYTYTHFGRLGKTDNVADSDAISTDPTASATTIRQFHQQTYDVLGRPLVTTTNLGTTTATYATAVGTGLLGLVDKMVQTLGSSAGITTSFSYYPGSNATHSWRIQQLKHSYTTGLAMKAQHDYTYDVDGTIATWRYQSPGNGTAIPAIDRTWTSWHDEVDQLTQVRSTLGTGNIELDSWRYAYEKMGNRTSELHGGQATLSTSDEANRLVQRGGAGTTSVTGLLSAPASVSISVQPESETASDPVAAQVRSIPGSSQWRFERDVALPAGDSVLTITADGGTPPPSVQSYAVNVPTAFSTYHYDANGNMLEERDGLTLALLRVYAWDAENRLRRITYSDGSSSEFQYDGASRRRRIIERDAANVVTSDKYLLWNGGRVWQERDSSRRVTVRHHHNGHELLTYVGASTTPSTTDQRLVLVDHLGSRREVIATAGAVERRRDYDPYGMVSETALTTAKANSASAYTGHYLHTASGLELTLYRAYAPALGRWISEDPIGEVGGVNLYGYVGNQPIATFDLLGLAPPQPPANWPDPPSNIEGGPWRWHPDPQNNRGGTLRPVAPPPKGQSCPTLTWSAPTTDAREGNPNGYWKLNDGQGGTFRYSANGSPITAATAHPGRPGARPPGARPSGGRPSSSVGIRGAGGALTALGAISLITQSCREIKYIRGRMKAGRSFHDAVEDMMTDMYGPPTDALY